LLCRSTVPLLTLLLGVAALAGRYAALFPDLMAMHTYPNGRAPVSDDLPDEYKVTVYRLVQEALNNAVRHSGARNARVTSAQAQEMARRLRAHFATRVNIEEGQRKGKIVVEFYSGDDFERIVKLMQIST